MSAKSESADPTQFEQTIAIGCPPTRVMAAFFDPHALAIWWRAIRSVTTARPLGVYAIEWAPTVERDDVLGRLGGVFHGTVMEYLPGRELFVADAWWLPPDDEPIGPMSLEVSCMLEGASCRLRVRQSGFEDSLRWRRYYAVITRGWQSSLAALKEHLEHA
ncbi:MAG TPA: SRPBCC domain-containing protein [Vicinamibacterales bacterium]